jgi:uncharacterized protein
MRLILCLFLACTALSAKPATVATVPNPRALDGGFVSDPDQILSAAERSELNDVLIGLEKETSVEYAVVLLNSIGQEVPKSFAVELFNTWGIGKAGKDNGLLLLVVLDQRRWEFETGYGLEGVLPDVTTSRLARDTFPAYFREKKYGPAIIDVSKQISEVLKTNIAEVSLTPEQRHAREERETEKMFTDYMERTSSARMTFGFASVIILVLILVVALYMRKSKAKSSGNPGQQKGVAGDRLQLPPMPLVLWLPFVLIWPVLGLISLYWAFFTLAFIYQIGSFVDSYLGYFVGAAAYLFLGTIPLTQRMRRMSMLLRENKDPGQAYRLLDDFNADATAGMIFFPLGYIPYWLYSRARLMALRSMPRTCTKCGGTMRRLGESEEDPHLEKGQILEETLASVDYDVWFCQTDSEILIEKYVQSSRYSECEKCTFVTSHVIRSWTITSPTYESSGQGAEEHECKNCGRKKETRYTIAKLVRSSSSGSSSGGSFSSSSRSSSGGGSSGSSFGGGRSGGGGSGGSW